MEFKVEIKGITPIIMHNGDSINPRTPAALEKAAISRKRGSNRTESDESRLQELECVISLWLNGDKQPAIPPSAIRACIETAARKQKQGGQVREGLIVMETTFLYDQDKYGSSLEELGKTTQYTTGVRVGTSRILRTRAMFEVPWSCVFKLDADEELVDRTQLESWLDIAGRRIGLGDWRPEKSGTNGRFELVSIIGE